MKLSYDHRADSILVELSDNPIISTKRINENFILDFDEFDEVVGIEILNAHKRGIDPLALELVHYPVGSAVERPDPEVIQRQHEAIQAARKRKQERAKQAQKT